MHVVGNLGYMTPENNDCQLIWSRSFGEGGRWEDALVISWRTAENGRISVRTRGHHPKVTYEEMKQKCPLCECEVEIVLCFGVIIWDISPHFLQAKNEPSIKCRLRSGLSFKRLHWNTLLGV